MARKTNSPKRSTLAAPEVSPEPELLEKTPGRLVIPLTAEGRPDVASMRPGTIERCRGVLMDAALLAELKVPVPISLETFSKDDAKELYGILGLFSSWAAKSVFGFEPEAADAALVFSEDELNKLADPTQRVLNKRIGSKLAKWKDESMLIMALGAVLQAKIGALMVYDHQIKAQREREQQQAPAPAPAPQTSNQ